MKKPPLLLKPVTHLAILYADRCDWRKLPGVPGAAFAIFANRRIKLLISGMSDIGDEIRRHLPSVPIPAIFCGHCCESPVKLTHQAG